MTRPGMASLAACLVAAAMALAPAGASAGWSRPAVISPRGAGIQEDHVAFAPDGTVAVGMDSAPGSTYLALRAPRGSFARARRLAHLNWILALGYARSTLELLTDSTNPDSPSQPVCCDYVRVVRRTSAGGLAAPETIVADLQANRGGSGIVTSGKLLPTGDGRMLAVISSAAGISLAAAHGAGGFGLARLIGPGVSPLLGFGFGADALDGISAVAFSSRRYTQLLLVRGARGTLPRGARAIAAARPSDCVCGSTPVVHGASVGVGWIEGTPSGSPPGRVELSEVSPSGAVTPAQTLVQGNSPSVALAGDRRGDELVAFSACRRCPVKVEVRRGSGPLGAPRTIGYSDESPLVALAPDGDGLVVWVHRKQVFAAELPRGNARFGRAHAISGRGADSPTLVYGPRGEAVAVWSRGNLGRIEASVFHAR